jgi:DNA-binding NtrC family response regulator
MFRLASFDLSGRRILILENEDDIAARMAEEIAASGGLVVGPVQTVESALALIRGHGRVDCVMLDVRLACETALPVVSAFRELSVETVFVTGFDDWFLAHDS